MSRSDTQGSLCRRRPAGALVMALLLLLLVVALSVSGCDIVIGGQATSSGTPGGGTPPGSHPTAVPPTATPTSPKLNRVVVRTTTTVAAMTPTSVTGFAAHVKCPTGKVSVGGGYYPDFGIRVTAGAPVAAVNDPTSSWEVYGVYNINST